MESKVKSTYDALLALQLVGSAAVTNVGSNVSSIVDLNLITKGRGDLDGRFGEGSFDVVFHVVALDHTTGDETYTVHFKSYDINGANGTDQETQVLTTANIGETYRWKFDTRTLQNTHAAAAQFGLDIVCAGTTPIFQYWAFIAPNLAWG
jgi:hypothetical protein